MYVCDHRSMSTSFLAAMETRAEDAVDTQRLKAQIADLKEELANLKKEKDVLMAVASGNWNRGDEFKQICREYFTEEYIQSCVGDQDSALVGEYFEDDDFVYKWCRDCDYSWNTKAYWEAGKGRVAFCYPAEDIEDGDVVCSLCYKGEEEYFPSDDEEEE